MQAATERENLLIVMQHDGLQQQQQVCFGEFGQHLTTLLTTDDTTDCCSVQAFEGIGGIKEFYLFLVDSQ